MATNQTQPAQVLVPLTMPGGSVREGQWSEIITFWRQCARTALAPTDLVTERLSWRPNVALMDNRTLPDGLVANAWQEVKLAYWDDLLSVLNTGSAVLKSDADVFFLRNPLSFMRRSAADIVAASDCESWNYSSNYVCTARPHLPGTTVTVEQTFRTMGFMLNSGLLFARSNERVISFLQRSKAVQRQALTSGLEVVSDQMTINQMLHLHYNCSWAAADGRSLSGRAAHQHLGLAAAQEHLDWHHSNAHRRGPQRGPQRGAGIRGRGTQRTAVPRLDLNRAIKATGSLFGTCAGGLTVEVMPYFRCPGHPVIMHSTHALALHPGGRPVNKLAAVGLLQRRALCSHDGVPAQGLGGRLHGALRNFEDHIGTVAQRVMG